MIKKIQLTALFAFACISLLEAQQTQAMISYDFLPNKTYETKNQTSSTNTTNLIGDAAFMKKMKESGNKMPVVAYSISTSEVIAKTGAIDKNGKIPFVADYKKESDEETKDGKKETTERPISGAKVYGHYFDHDKIKVDSAFKKGLTPDLKKSIMAEAENTDGDIKYPEKLMKIGESFTQEMPMVIPLDEEHSLQLMIITNYQLKKIEKDIAFFDSSSEIKVIAHPEDLTVSGGGKGKLQYSIINKHPLQFKTGLLIKLKLDMTEFKVLNDLDSQIVMDVLIK